VSMDFTLYKESKDGTWLTTHSLNLNPGVTYDDESSAGTLTGRYVLYSAPHSQWASFPSFQEMAALQAATTPAPAATPEAAPTPPVITPPVPTPPVTTAPVQPATTTPAPYYPDTKPPGQ
ncbi:MAG: hypothetical protein ABI166_07255, partial [Mucilaginibacter sp.]